MKTEKLSRFLHQCGFASRRRIREMIHEGDISINKMVCSDPNALVDPENDKIYQQNKIINTKREKLCYFILNKPKEVVSTLIDPQKRSTIAHFMTGIRERVVPVGRLDYHSEGLILLTNDGDLTNFIISTRNKIPKTYEIKIKGILENEIKQRLEKGVFLEGKRLQPFSIQPIRRTGSNNSWLRVTIIEGKKHILRKAFLYNGHPVEKLKRISIGTIALKNLPLGHWRELTEKEISHFKATSNYYSSQAANPRETRIAKKSNKISPHNIS